MRFTDEALLDLCAIAQISDAARQAKFGRAVYEAAELFLEDLRRLHPSEIREEIQSFHGFVAAALASNKAMDVDSGAIKQRLQTMSPDVREVLNETITCGGDEWGASLGAVVAHLDHPAPERREEALFMLEEACVAGIGRVSGRRRPNGKRSRPRIELSFVGPPVPPAGRLSNDAMYMLVWRVAYAYSSAAGRKAARWNSEFSSPFTATLSRIIELLSNGHPQISVEDAVRRLDRWLDRQADLSGNFARTKRGQTMK